MGQTIVYLNLKHCPVDSWNFTTAMEYSHGINRLQMGRTQIEFKIARCIMDSLLVFGPSKASRNLDTRQLASSDVAVMAYGTWLVGLVT